MKNLQEYIEFVEMERQQQQAEHQSRSMLNKGALAWLGFAVDNLVVAKMTTTKVVLTCNVNHSRFRPGDKLVISKDNHPSFKAVLNEIHDNGKMLILSETKMHKHTNLKHTKGWTVIEDYSDLTYSIQSALHKLMPGAPGWTFAKYLLGKQNLDLPQPDSRHKELLSEIADKGGLSLDETKKRILSKCLANPEIYGVQGPPGTGKTVLIAYAAEGLLRMGKRVVVLAPTHQAVNNVLSTINKYFPERTVAKYGDELRKESLSDGIPIITKHSNLSIEGPNAVIGMTFMAAVHHLMISKKKMLAPNIVIIDEAGQLPLVQGLCVGLSGAGSILLFGDDKQMPPVVSSELTNDYRALSLFAQLRSKQPNAIDVIDVTYRLNRNLCEVIGKVYYPNANLRPGANVEYKKFYINNNGRKTDNWISKTLQPDYSLVWLHVDSSNCKQVNAAEAEVVSKTVHNCLEGGITEDNIAVVTPFRRQAMQIRQLISQKVGDKYGVPIVDTVERVQGLTVEIVIVSLCASDPEYIKTIADFLFSPNRMNVAISRARTKAIVVSFPELFNGVPQTYSGLLARNMCRKLLKSKGCHEIKCP